MKHLCDYIFEHYVNLVYDNIDDVSKMKKYSRQVWDILSSSYSYCGGIAGCSDYDDFVREYIDNAKKDKLFWKLVRRNDKITALHIYTLKRGGRKVVLLGSIDTEEGKTDIKKLVGDDYRLKERGVWAELSGKSLSFSLNNGAQPLPSHIVKALMPDKEINLLDDGYFYKRKIGSDIHIKCLVGYPKSDIEIKTENSPEFVSHIKELAKKYSLEEEKLNKG